jgi:L-asparaginase
MAEVIRKEYAKWDGFVILHGTDTMAYTASALSFIFRNLAKPVVITGSQLPIFDERTDGRLNLSNAIQIAGYKATGLPCIPEVVLCFGNSLLRGNRTRKESTSDLSGFVSPNCPPLGILGEHISINPLLPRQVPDESRFKFSIETTLGSGVMDISLFPGLEADALGALLESSKIKGVIMRTFGAGNAMNDPGIHDVLKRAIDAGKPILNVTQCPKGMVEMGLYAASSALMEIGVISGLDMTPEAALTKMLWLLGTEQDDESRLEAQLQLQINQRGEQSESLFDIRYGSKGSSEKAEFLYRTAAQPSGQYVKERLKRAVLRISGLNFESGEGTQFDLCVFVSHSEADVSSDFEDPRCAVRFAGSHKPGETLIADVTRTIDQFTETGRRISLTVVSRTQARFWYDGVYLALFASE